MGSDLTVNNLLPQDSPYNLNLYFIAPFWPISVGDQTSLVEALFIFCRDILKPRNPKRAKMSRKYSQSMLQQYIVVHLSVCNFWGIIRYLPYLNFTNMKVTMIMQSYYPTLLPRVQIMRKTSTNNARNEYKYHTIFVLVSFP